MILAIASSRLHHLFTPLKHNSHFTHAPVA